MDSGAVKLAGGALLLIGIWVAVFWLWEPRQAPISYMEEPTLPPSKLTGEATAVPVQPDAGSPQRGTESSRPSGGSPTGDGAKTASSEGSKAPTGSGAGQTKVVPPEFEEYVVQAGDSYASIARRFFGNGAKATIIANANPFKDPQRLQIGDKLKIPKDPNNIQGRVVTNTQGDAPRGGGGAGGSSGAGEAGAAASRTYTVKAGDTLGEISTEMYGTSRLSDVILRANRSILKKAEDLKPGMTLSIPPKPADSAR